VLKELLTLRGLYDSVTGRSRSAAAVLPGDPDHSHVHWSVVGTCAGFYKPVRRDHAVADKTEDLKQAVEGGDGIFVVRGSGTHREWNGIRYKTGLSSMNVATIPPGGVAYAHVHVDFDVMLYILQGRVRHEYGPGLTKKIDNEAGDFIYIEPGVPHEVFNLSDTDPVVAVVARSDASEWENIIPYDRTRDRPQR
jgi:uncharacterized RmlC-like cupin family protein